MHLFGKGMLKLIFKTQLYTIGIQLLNIMVLFIFLKYLDKETYGEYVLYQGNLALFLIVFSQNLYIYTRVKISGEAKDKQYAYLKTTFFLILSGILVSSIILYVVHFWFDIFSFFGLNKHVLQFLFVATLEVLITEFIRFFLAIKSVNKRNNLQLIQRLSFFLILGFSVFVLKLDLSFGEVLFMLFCAQLVSFSYALFNIELKHFVSAKLIVKEFWQKAYRAIIPFLPIGFSTTIINYTDRLLINHFLDIDSLAEYGIITQIISMSNMLIGMSVILPVFPYAVEAFNQKKLGESNEFFKKMMNIGLLIALIFSIFFVLNYSWFLELIGDGKYKQSDLLVVLMSFNTVFYVIITTLSHYFQLMNKIRNVIFISVGSMLLNVVLNYTLIPHFGIVGSAFSSLFTVFTMSFSLSLYGLSIDAALFKKLYLKNNVFFFVLFLGVLSLILYLINTYTSDKLLFIVLKNVFGIVLLAGIAFLFYKDQVRKIMQKITK